MSESRPLDAAGNPALDVRVEITGCSDRNDGTGVILLRVVDTPDAEVMVAVDADEDLAAARDVFERICASLRIDG